MPKHDPICPNCAYSLKGHTPTDQANPDDTAKITCPECGKSTMLAHALATPTPNKHPVLTTLLALFVITALTAGCCAGIWQGPFYWMIGAK